MGPDMPKVSVIIPVYNGERYIAATLETVFEQTFRDFEVIVVDDGSTDGTEAILRHYGSKIVYLKNDHGGPASSRNLGISVARGDFIAFLDADDLWLPTKLERQVAFAALHPDFGIITTDAATFDHTGVTEASAAAHKYIPSGHVLNELLFDNWIGTSCAMVRRECFEKVGPFDQEAFVRGEDWVMWMRIAAIYPVYFLNEVLIHYRVHSQNYSRADLEKQFRDLFINFDKVERAIPQLAARPDLMRKARFLVCLRRGTRDLQTLVLEGARNKLRMALHYRPWSVRAWLLLGTAHLPLRVLGAARKTIRAARRCDDVKQGRKQIEVARR
jgi:glycosyltransferase involved in cell wall biosynthesis